MIPALTGVEIRPRLESPLRPCITSRTCSFFTPLDSSRNNCSSCAVQRTVFARRKEKLQHRSLGQAKRRSRCFIENHQLYNQNPDLAIAQICTEHCQSAGSRCCGTFEPTHFATSLLFVFIVSPSVCLLLSCFNLCCLWFRVLVCCLLSLVCCLLVFLYLSDPDHISGQDVGGDEGWVGAAQQKWPWLSPCRTKTDVTSPKTLY